MEETWDALFKVFNKVSKAVAKKDSKAVLRSTRFLSSLRKNTNLPLLAAAHQYLYDAPAEWSEPLLIERGGTKFASVEVNTYLTILASMHMIKEQRNDEAAKVLLQWLDEHQDVSSHTLDPLLSKVYYYLSLAAERVNMTLDWQKWYRFACLRHELNCQATLLNIMLRNLLLKGQVEQARNLALKGTMPENPPHAELSRYLYYIGLIKAIQTDYPEAHLKLTQAIRKAPESTANGFKLAVKKLLIIVELLMGEIPSRKMLVSDVALTPYMQLVQAVRRGSLEMFAEVTKKYETNYAQDRTINLVCRLRHLVIKSGLRRINIAYSNISLKDVSEKLGIQESDIEFIVSKAIRDGVIEASIDHDSATMCSRNLEDIYTTYDPQSAFHKRIVLSMELRNDVVRALQYPEEKKEEKPSNMEDDLVNELEDLDLDDVL